MLEIDFTSKRFSIPDTFEEFPTTVLDPEELGRPGNPGFLISNKLNASNSRP